MSFGLHGPSMNILIKLTCLIGLVIAPILGGHADDAHAKKEEVKKEIKIEAKKVAEVENIKIIEIK